MKEKLEKFVTGEFGSVFVCVFALGRSGLVILLVFFQGIHVIWDTLGVSDLAIRQIVRFAGL